jgi:hypothetical protein
VIARDLARDALLVDIGAEAGLKACQDGMANG